MQRAASDVQRAEQGQADDWDVRFRVQQHERDEDAVVEAAIAILCRLEARFPATDIETRRALGADSGSRTHKL
jgi:hypothetical protein